MTLAVYIAQNPSIIPENTGIGRVIYAQYKHLPDFDIQLTSDPESADIRVAHANGTKLRDLDILICHGLYWTGDYGSGSYAHWNHEINSRILHDARRARAITVPSDWVAEPFRRDMRLSPHVIGHGIEIAQWTPGTRRGYVLWNKNRAADVCDPTPAWDLALRGVRVISTFAPVGKPRPETLRVTGSLPHSEMHELIRGASIYLATTKETFGIGTLEAMACGIPVLGYRWGGTADLVRHGIDGYLVEPGDIDGLMEGLDYIETHAEEMREAARERAEAFTWDNVMARYANLFYQVASEREQETHTVSIVITNYNYGRYVSEAITSCLNQTVPPEEIIVVDDGSNDPESKVALESFKDTPSVQIIYQSNAGVAEARNRGLKESISPFVICLDADDKLDPHYIEALLPALRADRGLGIAYTGLGFIQPSGEITPANWPIAFDWAIQSRGGVPPGNCIPAAAMFRKSLWERAGGYRQEYAPGEDAEFWTRGLSVGFTARKVVDDAFFHYRAHSGSASRSKPYVPIDTWHPWMKDKLYPMAAPSAIPPLVQSYSHPIVSIIAPHGDDDEIAALAENLLGQTFRAWELVVRDPVSSVVAQRYPFLKYEVRSLLRLFLAPGERLIPTGLMDLLQEYSDVGGDLSRTRLRCKEGIMAKSCCGGASTALANTRNTILSAQMRPVTVADTPDAPVADGKVRMEFIGQRQGAITYKGEDLRRMYRGGNSNGNRFIDAHPDDVMKLLRSGDWQLPKRPEKPVPVVVPVEQEEAPAPAPLEVALAVPEAVTSVEPERAQKRRGKR